MGYTCRQCHLLLVFEIKMLLYKYINYLSWLSDVPHCLNIFIHYAMYMYSLPSTNDDKFFFGNTCIINAVCIIYIAYYLFIAFVLSLKHLLPWGWKPCGQLSILHTALADVVGPASCHLHESPCHLWAKSLFIINKSWKHLSI